MFNNRNNSSRNKKDDVHIHFGFWDNSKYMISMIYQYKKVLLVMMIICAFIQALNNYLWSFIGKFCIDMIQNNRASQGEAINYYVEVLLVIFSGCLMLQIIRNVCHNRLFYNILYIRMKMSLLKIEKSIKMNYQFLEQPKVRDLMSSAERATIGTNGLGGMMYGLYNIIGCLISFLFASAIIFTLNPVIIVFVVLITVLQFFFFKRTLKCDKKVIWDEMAPISRRIGYMYKIGTDFSYAKDIRVFHMKDWLRKRQLIYMDERLDKIVASKRIWLNYDLSEKAMAALRNIILYGYLIYRVLYTDLSIGNFTLYITCSLTLSYMMLDFFKQLGGFAKSSAETDDFRSFLMLQEEESHTIELPEYDRYEFCFENVSFAYPNQKEYTIKNLNLTIKAGERLAVVGINGAGKTTLIKLLLRLYDVSEGRILLNDVDIRKYDREAYYQLFAPVFQNVEIYAFSMAENVAMKRPTQTDKMKAEHMLKLAGMEEKLKVLKNGVDTQLLKIFDSEGIELSGGEKQKLALARALYKDAPAIVLDEPTAALDALAEYKLYSDFDKLIGNRTAVYISHRLSSTKFCDKVAMLDNGKLIEYGSHEELLGANGEYAKMFQLQAQYYNEQ